MTEKKMRGGEGRQKNRLECEAEEGGEEVGQGQ